mgnify:CR=1 FL=1
MKTILVTIALLLSSIVAAHEDAEPPNSSQPNYDAALYQCFVHGARAAWGADARFHSAPLVFKYVSTETVKAYMFGRTVTGDKIEVPTDGIYISEDLDLTGRKEYEQSALYGWKQADVWIKAGKSAIDRSVLLSIFADDCKQHITVDKLK